MHIKDRVSACETKPLRFLKAMTHLPLKMAQYDNDLIL